MDNTDKNEPSTLADGIIKQATTTPDAATSRAKTKGLMTQAGQKAEAELQSAEDDMQAYINQMVGTIREERSPYAVEDSLRPVARPGSEKPRPKARPEGLGTFKQRMMQSESSGDSDVQITISDGRKMTGGFQFGDARLKDYMKDTGVTFTTEEFRNDPELQSRVFDWHVADIDRVIDSLDSEGYKRDGLRAVAHLGGIKGMKKYVNSGGKYNPKDDFGTRLSDYYDKFS